MANLLHVPSAETLPLANFNTSDLQQAAVSFSELKAIRCSNFKE
jgi:hypothetical protein